jgi:hypothetical protein
VLEPCGVGAEAGTEDAEQHDTDEKCDCSHGNIIVHEYY